MTFHLLLPPPCYYWVLQGISTFLLNVFCKVNSTIPFLAVSQAFPPDQIGPAHRKVEDQEPLRVLGCRK